MCLYDGVTNRQPHAHSFFFRSEEGVKGPFRILKAGSVIPHLDDGGM
jgi:hypothetical protein